MTVLKRRRLFLVGLAVAGLATIGWGCRQASMPAGTLQLWTLQLAPKFNPYMDAVIGSWEQDHPDAPVRWTDLPWGSVERKLLAAVFARTAPDVVNLNPPFAANLGQQGWSDRPHAVAAFGCGKSVSAFRLVGGARSAGGSDRHSLVSDRAPQPGER